MKSPKFPSVKHLPWSEEDARRNKYLEESDLEDLALTDGKVVMTEKMDGANSCMTSDKIFARSHSGEAQGRQFDLMKKKHREEYIHRIPNHLAIYGEWLYAKHSIKYTKLPRYFLVFDIYDMKREMWLSWENVEKMAQNLGMRTVPTIKRGYWKNEDFKIEPEGESFYGDTREGYVLRRTCPIEKGNYVNYSAKCVREDHVSTEELHWRKGEMEINEKFK